MKYVTNKELMNVISERKHLINLLLKSKDRLPVSLTINELLCPTGISIYDYCNIEEQVDAYINELKRRNNIWYVVWYNIKVFIKNLFKIKYPNC